MKPPLKRHCFSIALLPLFFILPGCGEMPPPEGEEDLVAFDADAGSAIEAAAKTPPARIVDLSSSEIAEFLKTEGSKDSSVLDLRTPEEFSKGHLQGAINVDFQSDDFRDQIEKLDPESTYVIHCQSGGRSGRSLEVFRSLGFKRILHMTDGYSGWTRQDYPVVTKDKAP